MARLLASTPDPAIVFTSDVAGLVVARAIVGLDHERAACLLEEASHGRVA